ncbi:MULTISPECIES: YhbY family RNA-binding protein [Methanococcoides]|uniref:YhbY family RNA-binding protein n=1 Tax=Methanococcoides seepicolus TaxID=2828780 RepID=A0A9E4ZGF8_9EURY|nr:MULTISPECIES: YhbY family RNA-binding protein [Methanococcoides]MCM1987136.1 YhbY family RNA-binding protein [Methanococcoides seepicolus]
MDKEKLYKLRSEATHIKPIVNVGKSGVTDQLIVELKKHIKERHLVKVKVLKSASYEDGIDAIAEALVEATKATLIDVRGTSVVLYR